MDKNGTGTTVNQSSAPRLGAGSFCVPRVAITALLNAHATAYEICTYLTLACFTDETGRYSPASLSALHTYTGANKTRNGPLVKALARLKTITAQPAHGPALPLVFDRDGWEQATGEVLPPPTTRGDYRHVLPDFGEAPEARVWFGKNLVTGVKTFDQPLRMLKDGGDIAARVLLHAYAANDMERWGGVDPHRFVYDAYAYDAYEDGSLKPSPELRGSVALYRWKSQSQIAVLPTWCSSDEFWAGVRFLEAAGFLYHCVVVLNRNPVPGKTKTNTTYLAIPAEAEPLYELDTLSRHGYKPHGEEGIGGITANTAGEVGHSVAAHGSADFYGVYAAMVLVGQPHMVAGLYRLRFRVSNPHNAGVKAAWARIYAGNRAALAMVNRVRALYQLPAAPAPFDRHAEAHAEAVEVS